MVLAAREELGPYLIYERLGVGGMAVVHRALERGLEGLERIVALKRLLPQLACDESIVRSFIREARLSSMLQHANIAQTFTFGRFGTVYFIAMEFVDGCSLRQVLRGTRTTGAPPVPVAVSLMRQLLDALDYAHERRDVEGRPLGLVHRDLSPTNLLISRSGHLKVIDFGIAESFALHTQTGKIRGKLAYMAPEVVVADPSDQRSDLYSVGVVFHELLTARPLFPYYTDINLERGEVPLPSAVRPDLPTALDKVVMRALATKPADRWASAAELRAALMEAVPIMATPPEVAAWCADSFVPAEPVEPMPPDPFPASDSDRGSSVVLDDVPDYNSIPLPPVPTVPLRPQAKWIYNDTIETHAVPPPSGRTRPQTPTSPPRTLPRADSNEVTTVAPAPEPQADSVAPVPVPAPAPAPLVRPPAPRRSRRWNVVIVGVVAGIAIGLVILLVPSRNHGDAAPPSPPVEATSQLPAAPPAPTTGSVTIEADPRDATVVIGEQAPHAGTPWTVELAPGTYPVSITASGHIAWATSLVVTAGGSELVHAALVAEPHAAVATATLALDSTPQGLEVVLDGQVLAFKTPIRMGIASGPHHLVVRDAGGTDIWATDFTAKDNQSHRFSASKPAPRQAVHQPDAAASDVSTAEAIDAGVAGESAAAPPPMTPPAPPIDDRGGP